MSGLLVDGTVEALGGACRGSSPTTTLRGRLAGWRGRSTPPASRGRPPRSAIMQRARRRGRPPANVWNTTSACRTRARRAAAARRVRRPLSTCPLLLTARGQVGADTKIYLYIDPGRLLSRAGSMWDPHVGMGTVTHQNIGYLWPMGPYYWAFEQLGVPDWVAQRLWLGSILFLAGLGVRYLLRTFGWKGPARRRGHAARTRSRRTLLTLGARISAHPAVVRRAAVDDRVLTCVALRRGRLAPPGAVRARRRHRRHEQRHRDPARWSRPAAVVPVRACGSAARRRPGVRSRRSARIGVLTLLASAWWMVGLSVQATNGIDVLALHRDGEGRGRRLVGARGAARPRLLVLLRRRPPRAVDRAERRVHAAAVAARASVPRARTRAARRRRVARWRERALLRRGSSVVGTDPRRRRPPVGRPVAARRTCSRSFLGTSAGLAMRSLPRADPARRARAGGAARRGRARGRPAAGRPPSAVVTVPLVLLVVANFAAACGSGTSSRGTSAGPRSCRRTGSKRARYLDATRRRHPGPRDPRHRLRVLPLGQHRRPGHAGADRPPVRRPGARALRFGASRPTCSTPSTVASKRTSPSPSPFAPVARIMRAGQVLVRSDLQYERYNTPRPRELWALLRRAPGLGAPVAFGAARPRTCRCRRRRWTTRSS